MGCCIFLSWVVYAYKDGKCRDWDHLWLCETWATVCHYGRFFFDSGFVLSFECIYLVETLGDTQTLLYTYSAAPMGYTDDLFFCGIPSSKAWRKDYTTGLDWGGHNVHSRLIRCRIVSADFLFNLGHLVGYDRRGFLHCLTFPWRLALSGRAAPYKPAKKKCSVFCIKT